MKLFKIAAQYYNIRIDYSVLYFKTLILRVNFDLENQKLMDRMFSIRMLLKVLWSSISKWGCYNKNNAGPNFGYIKKITRFYGSQYLFAMLLNKRR
jgi:hypothetical protein